MSYCLNPSCLDPENPPQSNFCRSCGGRLRLRDRYLAVQPIGQGGFGRTFKAIDEDKPSKPFCVIKQFFPQVEGTTAAQKAAELFTQEASALERLDYPNIPKLLAYFITPDGRQYLVQEFIDGQNLKLELEWHGKLSESQVCELLTTILMTLDYIHQLGFIHRDIKPENIIRRADNRQLYLVDFGAAKITDLDRPQMQGTTIGTPEFMSPEQGWGRAFPSSDLYSLGVTCLNLLTGISPFKLFDDNRGEWIWRDNLTNSINPQLATILDKLIQAKPIDRYQSARAAIDALQLGLSTTAIPLDPPQPKQIAAVVNNLPIGFAPKTQQLDIPTIKPQQSAIPLAQTILPIVTSPTPASNPVYTWQEDYLFLWHNKPINAIGLSIDGQYLISGDDGGTVAVWNLTMPQQPIGTYCNNNPIYAVAISPNHSQIASGDRNRRVQLRRRESLHNSLQELHADPSSLDSHSGFVYSVGFSPDGSILASSGADRRIRLWNTNTSKIITTFNEHQDAVMAMQFMPNGKILVSAGADRSIRFWDLEHKQLLKTITTHEQAINALAISRDGKLIISGSSDRTVQIRELGSSNLYPLIGHQDAVQAVAISPDGKIIASGSIDGIVNLWDTDSHQLINSFPAHQAAVKSIVFQINSRFLITASLDRTIKIWRAS
jgi:serine/threonine protein kinase